MNIHTMVGEAASGSQEVVHGGLQIGVIEGTLATVGVVLGTFCAVALGQALDRRKLARVQLEVDQPQVEQ